MIEPDTKSHILSTALDLFAHLGYEKTTMRAIAKKVGITSASIYYFYNSKEDLLNIIFFEFESNFAKYRNAPNSIFKAAVEKPLPEILSMIFYTFGSVDESNRMMTIARVILSLQYENIAAQELYEKVMVHDALDYGVKVLKGLHLLGIIKEIDFKWTSNIFRSFAISIFEENLRHLKSYADAKEDFKEGIRYLCESFAQIIGV